MKVDEMQFTMTMNDGSKKKMRFTLKDAKVNNDETSLEFIEDFHREYSENSFPVTTKVKRMAKLVFNWAAFDLEIIDLD